MAGSAAAAQERGRASMSPVELIATIGYELTTAWMIITFYWLFCDFPPNAPIQGRDFAQMWIFLGIPVGYITMHLLGKRSRFSLFYRPVVATAMVGACLLPIICIIAYQTRQVPFVAFCVTGAIAGLSYSALNVAWLDVASRLKISFFGRYTGLALAVAALIFVLTTFLPTEMQPVFCLAYVLLSVGLLVFATTHADGNDSRAPEEATTSTWYFAKEIEPSLFMFGIVFSLSFVFVFNFGRDYVFLGLASIIPGAALAALLSILHEEFGITVVQRALAVLMVITCILTPFSNSTIQLACACVMIASWAFFTSVNFGFILKKIVKEKSAPFFRQAPIRMFFNAGGFALGWVITACVTIIYGTHSEVFVGIRLASVVALVLVMMIFIPNDKHHDVSGKAFDPAQEEAVKTTVVNVEVDAEEAYAMRCEKVAKLFQLSPREKDVLLYLGKGRNVAYIQEKLVVSPHTVKSHIYNIYRKTDIHSQQKLMDFIEEVDLEH